MMTTIPYSPAVSYGACVASVLGIHSLPSRLLMKIDIQTGA